MYFPCLFALARISSVMLNRSDERRHTCIVPDVAENKFNLSPVSTMLGTGFWKLTLVD